MKKLPSVRSIIQIIHGFNNDAISIKILQNLMLGLDEHQASLPPEGIIKEIITTYAYSDKKSKAALKRAQALLQKRTPEEIQNQNLCSIAGGICSALLCDNDALLRAANGEKLPDFSLTPQGVLKKEEQLAALLKLKHQSFLKTSTCKLSKEKQGFAAQTYITSANHALINELLPYCLGPNVTPETVPQKYRSLAKWLAKHPFYARGIAHLPVPLQDLGEWSFDDLALNWKVRGIFYRGISTHIKLKSIPYDSQSLLEKTIAADRKSLLPYALATALANECISPAVSSNMLYPLFQGAKYNSLINNGSYMMVKKNSVLGAMPMAHDMPVVRRRRITSHEFMVNLPRRIIKYFYLYTDLYRNAAGILHKPEAPMRFNTFDTLVALKYTRMFMQAEIEFLLADQIEKDLKGRLPQDLNELNEIYSSYQKLHDSILNKQFTRYVSLSNMAVYIPFFAQMKGGEFMSVTGTEFCYLPNYMFPYAGAPLNDLLYYNVEREQEGRIKMAVKFVLR